MLGLKLISVIKRGPMNLYISMITWNEYSVSLYLSVLQSRAWMKSRSAVDLLATLKGSKHWHYDLKVLLDLMDMAFFKEL